MLVAVILTGISYAKSEWSTTASAMSVITAVLAIWISLNLTWQQEDAKQPQITLFIDNNSHKHAYSLVIKNEGGSPAYNVRICWTKPIYDYANNIPRFTDFEDEDDFICLPTGLQFSRFLIGSDTFRELCNNGKEPLVFEGDISFSVSPKNKYRESQSFKVSFEPFKKRLNVLNDQMDFYSENIKLTSHLKSIAESLKEINKQILKRED